MSSPPSDRIPSYRFHHASGQAVVSLSGRDYYLGPHGSPESRQRYQELVGRWLAHGRRLPDDPETGPTVGDLCRRYLEYALQYYRKNGKTTSQIRIVRPVVEVISQLYGSLPISEFNRDHFKTVRNHWLITPSPKGTPVTRYTINVYTQTLRAMFRWGAEEGIVPASVLHEVNVPRGLLKGRTTAPDRPPVGPPPMESVEAVLLVVRPVIRALIELQRLTGMRPGEVCAMRGKDIDRKAATWHYLVRDEVNKTAHRGKVRIVSLGPRARAILEPWLRVHGDGPLFRDRTGRAFTVTAYRLVVMRACRRAGVPHWHPHRLRHTCGGTVRAELGLEAAQAVLGHSERKVTERYATLDTSLADEAAERLG